MVYEPVDALRSGMPGGCGFGGAGWRLVGRWVDVAPEQPVLVFGGPEGVRWVS
jgi:hypothetical protein